MNKSTGPNETIGCTLLTDCFWLPEDQWIEQPSDWSPNIVQGKCYESAVGEGARLWAQVRERLLARADLVNLEQNQGAIWNALHVQASTRSVRLSCVGFRCLWTSLRCD
jgi:putative restriction endonuclease